MSNYPDAASILAEMEERAAIAACFSARLEHLALALEGLGGAHVAQQLRMLDVPELLTLPSDQALALLGRMAEALERLHVAVTVARTAI